MQTTKNCVCDRQNAGAFKYTAQSLMLAYVLQIVFKNKRCKTGRIESNQIYAFAIHVCWTNVSVVFLQHHCLNPHRKDPNNTTVSAFLKQAFKTGERATLSLLSMKNKYQFLSHKRHVKFFAVQSQ